MDSQRFDGMARTLSMIASRRRGVGLVAALASLVIARPHDVEAARCGDRQEFGGECWPDAEETQFLNMINDYRRSEGKAALNSNPQLAKAAELHAQYQAKKTKMTHRGPKGKRHGDDRMKDAGYNRIAAWGENVLWHSANGEAGHAFRGWRNSPGHNRNMVSNDFTDIGIARARARNGAWYWTTDFGDQF